jgi:hypothetical protein
VVNNQVNNTTRQWWHNRVNIAIMAFLAIGGYFLFTEHRAHVIGALPWILVAACLVMHLFMHGGHGHGDDSDDHTGEKS